jgi:hypothetical protein
VHDERVERRQHSNDYNGANLEGAKASYDETQHMTFSAALRLRDRMRGFVRGFGRGSGSGFARGLERRPDASTGIQLKQEAGMLGGKSAASMAPHKRCTRVEQAYFCAAGSAVVMREGFAC